MIQKGRVGGKCGGWKYSEVTLWKWVLHYIRIRREKVENVSSASHYTHRAHKKKKNVDLGPKAEKKKKNFSSKYCNFIPSGPLSFLPHFFHTAVRKRNSFNAEGRSQVCNFSSHQLIPRPQPPLVTSNHCARTGNAERVAFNSTSTWKIKTC